MDYKELIEEAHEHQKGKVCTKCNTHKPLNEFYNKVRGITDRLATECKSCAKKYIANKCPITKWFQTKKSNAKRDGIEFTIKLTDIPGVKIKEWNGHQNRISWKATQYPKVCPILKIKLDWGMNGYNDNSPSLDRIDPTEGYVKGNVMMMSALANRMKQNATPEQLKQFSRYILFGKTNK